MIACCTWRRGHGVVCGRRAALNKRQSTRNESECSCTTLISCGTKRLREACGAAQEGSGACLTCSANQSRPPVPLGSQSEPRIPMSRELAKTRSRNKCLTGAKLFFFWRGGFPVFLSNKITTLATFVPMRALTRSDSMAEHAA